MGRAADEARPGQLTMDAAFAVQVQPAAGAVDFTKRVAVGGVQGADEVIGVEAHGVQARKPAVLGPVFGINRRQVLNPRLRIDEPGYVREHHAVQIAVGTAIHRINGRRGIYRQVARVMKFQLRLEQAAGGRVGSEENELRILAPCRKKFRKPAQPTRK